MNRTELVKELVKPGEDIVAAMTPHKAHMLHMAVGLVDEAIELLGATGRANVLEELGDAKFYLEGLYIGMNWSKSESSAKTDTNAVADLLIVLTASGEVLGDVKRYAIQNKTLDQEKLRDDMYTVHQLLNALTELYGFTDDEIHTANYLKLKGGEKARYANGYSDEAAAARADKA